MAEPTPNTNIVLDQKKILEIQKTVPKKLAQAKEFHIVTSDDYDASASFLQMLDGEQKKIEDFFDGPAKQANSVHKFITGLRKTLVTPLEQATALIQAERRKYRDEKERERLVLQEEERKKASAERDQQAIDEAAKLVAIGEHEAANIVLDRTVNAPAPPVIVPSQVPKQAGISVRKVWKFKVTNPDLIKREYLIPRDPYDVSNYPKAKAVVEKLGPDAAALIGGIEVFPDEIESVRSK